MNTLFLISLIILFISFTMAMVGKGGGNFYVLVMVLAGLSMQKAATNSQLIMMGTSLASMLVFHKNKKIDWKLALIIDPPTDIMAFFGGFFASRIQSITLKIMFAFFLVLISVFMLIPVKEKINIQNKKFGYWNRTFENYNYSVNLFIVLPITAIVGFFSGAIGISGGAFKIPLMVMLCGIPMEIAIGTSSAMVAATALMGFIGHSLNGDFSPQFAIPLTIIAIIRGLLGIKNALKNITNLIAAIIMNYNILSKK